MKFICLWNSGPIEFMVKLKDCLQLQWDSQTPVTDLRAQVPLAFKCKSCSKSPRLFCTDLQSHLDQAQNNDEKHKKPTPNKTAQVTETSWNPLSALLFSYRISFPLANMKSKLTELQAEGCWHTREPVPGKPGASRTPPAPQRLLALDLAWDEKKDLVDYPIILHILYVFELILFIMNIISSSLKPTGSFKNMTAIQQ